MWSLDSIGMWVVMAFLLVLVVIWIVVGLRIARASLGATPDDAADNRDHEYAGRR